MELDGTGGDLTSGQLPDWRVHMAHKSLFRGLVFPLFYFMLVGMNWTTGVTSVDWWDIFFLLLFGGLASFNFLTFARTHKRRYARFPLSEEDAARAIERALNGKFLTYKKKNFFPPTTVKGVKLSARYIIDMSPVSVVIAYSQKGTVVCIGPEKARTEEQMMMLTIAISNELAKGVSSGTDGLGQVHSLQGLDFT